MGAASKALKKARTATKSKTPNAAKAVPAEEPVKNLTAMKAKRKKGGGGATAEPAKEAGAMPDIIPTPKGLDRDVAAAVAESEASAAAAALPEGANKKSKAHRLLKEAPEDKVPRGVIYIGHLPKGFFEPQMHKFFKQFGNVKRLRICRSKRNAQSKGYAFVEFEEESVAKVVASTMHKYLLFEKQLVVHVVPKEKQHPALFHNCNTRMRNLQPLRRKHEKVRFNERPSIEVDGEKIPQTTTRQAKRRGQSDRKLATALLGAGISYKLEKGEEDDHAEAEEKQEKPASSPKPKTGQKRKEATPEPAAMKKKGATPSPAATKKQATPSPAAKKQKKA